MFSQQLLRTWIFFGLLILLGYNLWNKDYETPCEEVQQHTMSNATAYNVECNNIQCQNRSYGRDKAAIESMPKQELLDLLKWKRPCHQVNDDRIFLNRRGWCKATAYPWANCECQVCRQSSADLPEPFKEEEARPGQGGWFLPSWQSSPCPMTTFSKSGTTGSWRIL
jgi:hypothetical protein